MNEAARAVPVFEEADRAERPSPVGVRAAGKSDALRLLGARIEYVPHPSFDDPDARNAILAPMPGPTADAAKRRAEASDGLSPGFAGLDDVPLMSRDQETHLFRQMNYLRYLAERTRTRIDPARPRGRDLEELGRLCAAAAAVKERIVRANLRLVIAVARRYAWRGGELAERISDGNLALLRAVDGFDIARGYKFSTYATWAIRNHLSRAMRREDQARGRLALGPTPSVPEAADTRTDAGAELRAQERRERVVARLLGHLDERERRVIVGRFGIGGASEETCRQLGAELGISKERVRQIESSARGKLRRHAAELEFLMPSA
jgi:RNA polymerase primary sigma factor